MLTLCTHAAARAKPVRQGGPHTQRAHARPAPTPLVAPQVPVGILANTALIKALCAVGRRAAALDHLRKIPTKRQRTPMFTWLLRSCNEAGEDALPFCPTASVPFCSAQDGALWMPRLPRSCKGGRGATRPKT